MPIPTSYARRMPLYLVERYAPGLDDDSIRALARRLRAATAILRREGRDVTWLESIALPSDDTCLCLFRACSDADVVEANQRAGADLDRVVSVQRILG